MPFELGKTCPDSIVFALRTDRLIIILYCAMAVPNSMFLMMITCVTWTCVLATMTLCRCSEPRSHFPQLCMQQLLGRAQLIIVTG